MRGTTLFFCFATLLCIKNVRALQVDYMDSIKSRIDLKSPRAGYDSSGILKSHMGSFYSSDMNKTVNVSAPYGYSLLVSIRLIDLRPSKQDQLTIFAINEQVSPVSFTNRYVFRNRTYYPNEDLTFFAPNGQVEIRFTTGSDFLTYGYDGFELTYTVVGNRFHCNFDYFRCNNGRCIANVLICDGHNHCGDQSSLEHCTQYGSVKDVGIAYGALSLIVLAVACGIFIIILLKHVRKARQVRKASGAEANTIIMADKSTTTG